MGTRVVEPTAADRAFRDDLIELLKKHSGHLSADRMLALAAHMVGSIVAMQDQRKFTAGAVMEIVSANIEAGNRETIENLKQPKGSA